MRAKTLKKISALTLGTVFVLSLCLSTFGTARAATPYFKTFGADVFSGGWFDHQDCPGTNFQDPDYKSPADNKYGGINAYSKDSGSNSAGGASSEFGAFALGEIQAGGSPSTGFYSGGAAASVSATNKSYLTFANNNTNASRWGGLFQGAVRQAHCIPDYFGTKQDSPTTIGSVNLNSLASGQYLVSAPGSRTAIASSPVTITYGSTQGKNIALFIDGDAYIKSNIVYQSGYNVNTVPKFALVVKGNIYIDPAVTRLDGFYIAQPADPTNAAAVDANSGVIWTCHLDDNRSSFFEDEPVNGLGTTPPATNPATKCDKQLVVNGAFSAKKLVLMRTPGNSENSTASTQEDRDKKNYAIGTPGNNVAEVINYSPEMVIGGPFFSSGSSFKVQSLISLPPIF